MNNKIHTATKISPFIANYGKELRMRGDIRKKEKVEKAMEFVKRMKKGQEEMKRQVDRGRKKTKDWKKGNRVMLSTKDLVLKKRPVRKLVD